MKIASTTSGSIVDGPGLRFTVFVQGCIHHCPGCHNPETHAFDGGYEISVDELAEQMFSDPLTVGLTLSGGDPMEQAADCARLAALARERGLSVWTYTGYTYEALVTQGDPDRLALLDQTDVLVDGPFIQSQKSYELLYRGSRNQRLIDLNAVRKTGKLSLWQRTNSLSHFTRPES